MRLILGTFAVVAALAVGVMGRGGADSADACAGLIGSNGAVNLGRTSTLAAYHDGVEHYVTAFEFQGGGGEFGTLIPLPGVPTEVERGGGWTLQRLQIETAPPAAAATSFLQDGAGEERAAEVLQEVRIDALDITVLKGGGASVAEWATEHGFRLSPDAPEVLEFYANRSPIFMAAVFDGTAAAERGQAIGDGTPVSLTIPTDNPWVPLRILGLGKQADDFIQADVFLLTDEQPAILPRPNEGMALTYSQPASDFLLDDLRSDDGTEWIPDEAYLTKLEINSSAADLRYDLAVDTSGLNEPSRVDAGLEVSAPSIPTVPGEGGDSSWIAWVLLAGLAGVIGLLVVRGRRDQERDANR
jgi:hypothetical protein